MSNTNHACKELQPLPQNTQELSQNGASNNEETNETHSISSNENHSSPRNETRNEREQYIFDFLTCKICFNRFNWASNWQVIFKDCSHTVCILCLLEIFLRRLACPFCRTSISPDGILFLQPHFLWPTQNSELEARHANQRVTAEATMRLTRRAMEYVNERPRNNRNDPSTNS